jgi:serine phosphatase RsbU (regulator of sigma subunit)
MIIGSGAVSYSAVPSIDITGYDSYVSLESPDLFLLMKGDSLSYAAATYDDSSWVKVTAPSTWEKTFPGWRHICWYRVHLRFPDTLPSRSLAVNLGVIVAADEVYFNGILIGRSGIIGSSPALAYDKKRLYEIPTALIVPGRDNVIAIRVLGFDRPYNGLFKGPLMVGNFASLQKELLRSDLPGMFFIIIYAFFATFFLIFYMKRRKDRYFLYFALSCLSMGIFLLVRTQLKYESGIGFFPAKKMEYLATPLLIYFLLEFFHSFFGRKRSVLKRIFLGYVVLIEVLYISCPTLELLIMVNHYLNYPSWILPIGMIFRIVLSEIRLKNRHAAAMGIIIIIFVGFVINDILVDLMFYNFPLLSMYGLFFLLLSFAVIMGKRFFGVLSELEDLNLTLDQKVRERTDELHSANDRLQLVNNHISSLNDSYNQEYLLAAKVQKGLTPQPFGNQYWRISVCFQPTGAISGDFYDIYRLDGRTLGLVLADAAGHGVAAALVTMLSKPVFMHAMKIYALHDMKAAMETANAELLEEIGEINEFLSAQAVRLELSTISFVNAGHPPAMLFQDGCVRLLHSSGPYLGVPEIVMPYMDETIAVKNGDCLLMFSDALIEARNESSEEFGISRVQSILERGFSSPENLITALTEEVYLFSGSRRLKDDLTIIACRRTDLA